MLFESCLIATALAFVNPADPSGQTMYPSGIKDIDNIIFSDLPACACPILTIGSTIKLKNGSFIKIGNYCLKPSVDESKIFIMQGQKIFCECQIFENTIVSDFTAKPLAKIIKKDENLILIYHIENILKKATIPIENKKNFNP